jgi:hypothetical protein
MLGAGTLEGFVAKGKRNLKRKTYNLEQFGSLAPPKMGQPF